ncbi:MAG: hypothetical protein WBI84_09080, partial [Burkholderiaceae bacterium]
MSSTPTNTQADDAREPGQDPMLNVNALGTDGDISNAPHDPTSSPQPAQSADPSASDAGAARRRYRRVWGSQSRSPWRAPQLDRSFIPVFLRNFLVWRKLAIPSLVGNIAEPLIWLVAFGYGMGALVGSITIDGTAVPYLLFLASGSICMSAMNAASFEALYSAFSRMHVQKTWDGIM